MSRTSDGGAKSATSTIETREPPARMVMSIAYKRSSVRRAKSRRMVRGL